MTKEKIVKIKKLITPTVLAFEKKLVPSDGYMYGGSWGEESTFTPLNVYEKSVRGTISNRQKPALISDPLKLNAKISSPNIQGIDACALAPEHDTLKVQFTLKVVGGIKNASACNSADYLKEYRTVVSRYIAEHGFKELGKRYATNIANGRFLWRNRSGAEEINVKVTVNGNEFSFNGLTISVKHFDNDNAELSALAKIIATALASDEGAITLTITAYARIGAGQTVYPSQELVLDDKSGSKTKKGKVLYSSHGIAALHEQKLGNALRTIDTWFKEYGELNMPIAVETYGAVTNLGKAFRAKNGENFYSLFDAWVLGDQLENDDQHFVMSLLVRGGIFGGKD